ncbi:UNVERIFIED_CONTAM: hypothetical protein Sradi_3927000 [Sesamum radiatum]|uniref:Uncharacterized protein n=1 Tax=Sesamum radiatum TaxID=300843 RepID=A0AAW2PJX1_SESRA
MKAIPAGSKASKKLATGEAAAESGGGGPAGGVILAAGPPALGVVEGVGAQASGWVEAGEGVVGTVGVAEGWTSADWHRREWMRLLLRPASVRTRSGGRKCRCSSGCRWSRE